MKSGKPDARGRTDWKTAPWHVLFLAAFPILALLAHNITEAAPVMALAPLAVSILATGILLLVAHALLKNWARAGLLVSILLALFFLYGHAYASLKGIQAGSVFIFRHRTLAPAWLILGVLGCWWAVRTRIQLNRLTSFLNLTGLVLVAMPLFQIGQGLWVQARAWKQAAGEISASSQVEAVSGEQQDLPDIYYIILDAYGRADQIQKHLDYDNTSFLEALEEQGFFIGSCSQSNYAQTELSLASSLNFNYLDELGDTFIPGSSDRSPLWPLIRHSAVRQFLEAQGYTTITFATGYGWSEVSDADIFFKPQTGALELNSFQYMLLQTTAGRILLDAKELSLPNTPDDLIRRRTTLALEKLPTIPSLPGPKFIFAHLLVPHSFVFGPNGEPNAVDVSTMTPEIFQQGYVDQLIYINRQIEELVAGIIAESSTPPVIILQGDHGPTSLGRPARVAIFNAYYLPGHADALSPAITPANTFRVVLDAYFNQDLPLLPDVARYSTYQDPYNYFEIENDCQP